MGRSYHNDNYDDDRDRRKTNKKLRMTKKGRSNDKKNLKEYTAGNLTEDDFFDMGGDDYDGKQSRI
jgi:hypothetical protein